MPGHKPDGWKEGGAVMGGSWGGHPATTVALGCSWVSPDGLIAKCYNQFNDGHEEIDFVHQRSEEDRRTGRPINYARYPTEEAARKDLPLDLVAKKAK